MSIEFETCGSCFGKGTVPRWPTGPERCGRCNGKGKVLKPYVPKPNPPPVYYPPAGGGGSLSFGSLVLRGLMLVALGTIYLVWKWTGNRDAMPQPYKTIGYFYHYVVEVPCAKIHALVAMFVDHRIGAIALSGLVVLLLLLMPVIWMESIRHDGGRNSRRKAIMANVIMVSILAFVVPAIVGLGFRIYQWLA